MTEVMYYRVAGDINANATSGILKTCIFCHNETYFLMTSEQFESWKVQQINIALVFPHIDTSVREWMISGTHPHCWDIYMSGDDSDDLLQEIADDNGYL